MSDLNLFSEIVKTLDFSNASKERLLQFVQQRDSRVINGLTNFIKQREGAVQDSQKHAAMLQLKTELEIVLFGRPIQNDQVIKTAAVTTYTTNVTSLPAQTTTTNYNTGPKTTYTTTTTTGAYNPTFTSNTVTPNYLSSPQYGATTTTSYGTGVGGNIGGTSSYATQNYTLPQTNTYTTSTTNTFGAGSQPGSTANLANPAIRTGSNANSASNDYYANLMAQMQSNPASTNAGSGQASLQVGGGDGEEVVKRSAARNQLPGYQGAKVQTNTMKSEYNKDNEIEKIRELNKPKLDVTVEVRQEQIRVEQLRIKEFKNKWQRDQPFHEDLYKLFDDITKDLDFPTFLSLRHKLHIDEIGVKELVTKQQDILKNKLDNKQSGINLNEFLTLMNAGSLNVDDVFFLLQIFFYLDFNKNRMLDADEILLGFVMLSSSSEKEKLEAAFSIVDEDGSGTLDISEMTTYMRSVIRMGDGRKMKADHSFEHEFLIEKIAAATAQGIFKEMDLNFDNRISYEEFIVWHNLHGSDVEGLKEEQQNVQKILAEAKKERTEKLLKFNAFTLQNDDFQKITNDRLKMVLDSKLNETSIQMFRDKLQLNHIKFLDAVHYLKEFKISERLGFGAFFNFMKDLYTRCQVKIDLNILKTELTEFYSAIDIDSNGFIDWNEILGAFSLLCTGTENEKIRGIFDVFDQNDDNILQFHEMYTLFLSSFNLIFMRNPHAALAREDPAKLAFSMALSAFSDNNLDPYSHGLDMNTFTEWYKKFDLI